MRGGTNRVAEAKDEGVPRRGRKTRGKVGFWLRLCAMTLVPLTKLLWKTQWRGKDNLPATGPAIVVMNHVSVIDPVMFASLIWTWGRVPRFMIKDTLWKVPIVRSAMKATSQIPVSRGSASATDSLKAATDALDRGEVVAIYPEGTVTRDPDYWPMSPRTGAARLWLARPDVPVIPIAQWGPQATLNYHTKERDLFPRKPAFAVAGPPIDFSEYQDKPVTAELVRKLSDASMIVIRDMLAEIRDEKAPDTLYDPVAAAKEARLADRSQPQAPAPDPEA